MKVLIGCERSGIVRDAFLARGHDAWSCDIMPADRPSNRHIQADIRRVIHMDNWDLLAVMHPPCTRLCNSGVRWLTRPPRNRQAGYPDNWAGMTEPERLDWMWQALNDAADLFSDCWNAPIPRVAIENPVMHKHAKQRIRNYQPFAQSVQPWQFWHDPAGPDNERKRTCFWLRDLPRLRPTGALDGTTARASVHTASPGADRATKRSLFFPGMATAMAAQWGDAATGG